MPKLDYKTLYEQTRFLYQLEQDLQKVSPSASRDRLIRSTLRKLGEVLETDLAFHAEVPREDAEPRAPYRIAISQRGREALERYQKHGGEDPFGETLEHECRALLKHDRHPKHWSLVLFKVSVGGRTSDLLGMRRVGTQFRRGQAMFGAEAARVLARHLSSRERDRVHAVKERIATKIFSEARPKDIVYQILHGLKKVFQYDHSAAVLVYQPDRSAFVVEAEIITWTKAKSEGIGRVVAMGNQSARWLRAAPAALLVRGGEATSGRSTVPTNLIAPLLGDSPGGPPARSRMLGLLRRGQRVLGMLQILHRDGGAFNETDLVTLEAFLPLASATVYNSALYASQRDRLVTAERKVGLADLARAVSHDLNNAFGVILPLLQTLQRDLAAGRIGTEQVASDLEVIEHYTASCSRIFQGMLNMGHGAGQPLHWYDINVLLHEITEMVKKSLEDHRIQLCIEFEDSLPTIRLRRGEFEQVVLNLIYNARDAMPDGGTLHLRSRPERGGILVEVEDTGKGIPEEIRERIFEPFFTTKVRGTGLGLDISRSIIWEYGGNLDLVSNASGGTTAVIWLPRHGGREKSRGREMNTAAAGHGAGSGAPVPGRTVGSIEGASARGMDDRVTADSAATRDGVDSGRTDRAMDETGGAS